MSNYLQEADDSARETVSEYQKEILERLLDSEEASNDLHNDYGNGDAYHHESHIDRWYSLQEAAELIDQLSDHEETDSGLWEGQQPQEAISTCAAFTYGNAVLSEWCELIGEINSAAETIIEDYDEQINDATIALDAAEKAEETGDEHYNGPSVEAVEELIGKLAAEREVELNGVIEDVING